jgi:hypothetical protein
MSRAIVLVYVIGVVGISTTSDSESEAHEIENAENDIVKTKSIFFILKGIIELNRSVKLIKISY